MFRKGKTCIKRKFHRTDLVIWGHSREGKPPSYCRINIVPSVQFSLHREPIFITLFAFLADGAQEIRV